MSHWVIGLDPGDSTGLAVVDDVGELVDVFQGAPHVALTRLRGYLLVARRYDVVPLVACERFVGGGGGRGRKTEQPTAREVIGAVTQLTIELAVELHLQAPVDAKRFATNALLRRLGLYVVPSRVNARDANDANDAVRHALLLTARRRATTFDRLLASRP